MITRTKRTNLDNEEESDRPPSRAPILSLRQKAALASTAYIMICIALLLVAQPGLSTFWETVATPNPGDTPPDTQPLILLWEDFEYPNDDWYVDFEGTGTIEHHTNATTLVLKSPTDSARATVLEHGWGSSYRDGEWLYTSIEIRLRLSHDPQRNDPGAGWRGWGFGVGPDAAHPSYSLCFSYYSHESEPELVGLRAQVTIDRRIISLVPLTGIDLQDWHTYTIWWGADRAAFLIDGDLVANTEQVPQAPMHIGIGLSNNAFKLLPNKQLDCSEIGLPLSNDASVQIDHIRVYVTTDKTSQYREDTHHMLQAASAMIQRAEDRSMDTEKMREYLAAATDKLANGYIPGHLYIKIRATAYLTTENLDQLSTLFHTATQKLQAPISDPRKRAIMEADYARAQDQWSSCNFALAEHYLQMIAGGTTQDTEEAQE